MVEREGPRSRRSNVKKGDERRIAAGARRACATQRGRSPRRPAGGPAGLPTRRPLDVRRAMGNRSPQAQVVIKRAAARKGTTELRWSSAGTRNTDRTTLVVTRGGSPTTARRQRRGGAGRRAGVRGQGSPRFALDVRWRWVTEPRAGRPRKSVDGGAGLGCQMRQPRGEHEGGGGAPRVCALDVRWRLVTEPRAGRPRKSADGGAGLGRQMRQPRGCGGRGAPACACGVCVRACVCVRVCLCV